MKSLSAIALFALTLIVVGCSDDDDSGSTNQAGAAGAAGSGANGGSSGSGGSGANAGTSGSGGSSGSSGSSGSGGSGAVAGSGGSAGTGAVAGSGGSGGSGGQAAYSFNPNDVSILFPAEGIDDQGMYRPTDQAQFGELLPLDAFTTVGPIARRGCAGVGCEEDEPIDITYPRLRVVGARIDPCFQGLPSDACRTQIRFVVQPVDDGGFFDDAALHVFYDIPEAEFATLVGELAALNAGASLATTGALRVHPVLDSEGATGAFGSALREILFSHIGASRLTRVTAMKLAQLGGGWEFHGFNFANGVPSEMAFFDSNITSQSIHNFGNSAFTATVDPTFPQDNPLSLFWDVDTATAAQPAEQQAAFDAALTIENPNLRKVDEVTCVACHTATPAKVWATNQLGLSADNNPNLFTSTFDLSLTVDPNISADTTRLRAFGYRADQVVLSQRLVNESAAVAASLNGM